MAVSRYMATADELSDTAPGTPFSRDNYDNIMSPASVRSPNDIHSPTSTASSSLAEYEPIPSPHTSHNQTPLHQHHQHHHHNHRPPRHTGPTQPSTAFLSALNGGRDHVGITASALESLSLIPLISHPYSGAVSSFIGTTRDSFEGKRVTRLTYEAYQPMASKCLAELVTELHKLYALDGVVIVHRIGDVLVGEWSVVIHVSSAHRKASLSAVNECIDKLKANVPIWKCEYYTDGSAWKQNQEFNKDHIVNKQTDARIAAAVNADTDSAQAAPLLTNDSPSTSPDITSAATNGIAHLHVRIPSEDTVATESTFPT